MYTYRWGSGKETNSFDLDAFILKDAPVYGYNIGFMLKGSRDGKIIRQAGVDWFRAESDLQVSPHSLPALRLGRNIIRYTDSGQDPRKIRITHTWREINDNHPPTPVTEALSPKEFKTLTPVLRWKAAGDPDPNDSVTDYQVMVSLRPDCRWPLSNSVYRNVGSPATEWKVPESFLNPGTTYYWKVRARDSKGAIGEWGTIFSFYYDEKREDREIAENKMHNFSLTSATW